MNANKKNSGWILRPSKSFPGKFYYFNVLNGDTAWSLEDTEKKDNGSPKVMDIHNHPEPSSPPPDLQPKHSFSGHPFGHSVKSSQSIPEEMNVIWTPIHMQVPIAIAPKIRMPNHVFEPRFGKGRVQPPFEIEKCQYMDNVRVQPKCTMEKVKIEPPFMKKQILVPCEELFVHALTTPLSQRFLNYETPVITFNKDNKVDKLYTSTPIKNCQIPIFKNIASNTDLSFEDLRKQAKESVCVVPSLKEKNVGIKLKESEPEVDSNTADLRLVLQARKRRGLSLELNTNKEKIESKKIKTVRQELPPKPKKRVSFEMDYGNSSLIIDNEYDDETMNFKDKYAITIQSLKSVAKPGLRDDCWYIVVDTELLLEEFNFLNELVKIDPSCKLMIPASVVAEISALTRGDCGGRARVTQARTVVRSIPGPNIIVPPANIEDMQSPLNDAILKSCVDAMDRKTHLILITNDEELLRSAKCYPIQCYNIKDIKNGLVLDPKPIEHEKTNLTSGPQFTQTETADNNFKSNLFEDLNDKEKEIITRFKKNLTQSKTLNEIPVISSENLRILGDQKLITNQTSLFSNVCSRISHQNSIVPNISVGSNSKVLNENTMISIDRSTNTYPNTTNSNTNPYISNVNQMCSTKPVSTEWCTKTGKKSSIFDEDSNLEFGEQNAHSKPQSFEMGIEPRSKFEYGKAKITFDTNKTKEVQNFEFKNNCNSKFEIDVFKMPQSIALKRNNSTVDLREFYVKSKVMENRLRERMDEFICFFSQIMEDTLSGVLEKLSPTVLKAIPPPWSMFEALQSTTLIYKDHFLVRSIVQELCTALYVKDVCGIDKMKKNVNPNEFMKALGCGIHLIKYLKNILPRPEELSNTEEFLLNMLKGIEDPTDDIIDPLVKLPTVSTCDYKEVKHNFVKSRSEIVNYLKKHYPEWQSYDEGKNKIVRTCGRDMNLLKLDKKVTDDTEMGVATRNITMRNSDMATRNVDLTTRIVNVPMNNVVNASKDAEKTTNIVGTINHSTRTDIKKDTENVVELPRLGSFKRISTETEIDRTNSPKIVRNMHIIDKFEKILKRKRLNPDEMTMIQNDYDDDITNYTNNAKKDHTNSASKQLSKENDSRTKNKKYPQEVGKHNLKPQHIALKLERTDSKIEGKSDKDDSTNDSGIGNESLGLYSEVTKFSSKLSCSLEKIRALIEGTLREFNSGRMRAETKKSFRLKAFETNFMLSKTITELSKTSDKKNNSKLMQGKTKDVILRCIKLSQMVQKTLNIILSASNEEELNSSLSLNVSS